MSSLTRGHELLYVATAFGFALSLSISSLFFIRNRISRKNAKPNEIRHGGITDLIGNTPLIRINSLSNALGVDILGKAEYLNPGGSVKDRVALRSQSFCIEFFVLNSTTAVLDDAETQGLLKPHTGSCIFEGTSGSTGISFATIARSRGYQTTIIMPDDISEDKVKALLALGANVERVRPASIVDKKQFVNTARQRATEYGVTERSNSHSGDGPRGYFADQFENLANYEAHFEGTGPEIWRQTSGKVRAFVSGAGTGGTISGVGNYLKSRQKGIIICLADPEGSGLHNKIKHGVMYDPLEREGTRRRHQIDSIVEGIGLNRLTKNIEKGLPIIDESFRVTDSEAVNMARYIAQHDGFFLGSSSACNLVACVRLAQSRKWCNGEKIVTILCDSGSRHFSKFWNDDYLRKVNMHIDTEFVDKLLGCT